MSLRLPLAVLLTAFAIGPAVAQERQWSLDAAGEDAYLVFGVPETDDVGVSLWCRVESGTVNLFIPEAQQSLDASKPIPMVIRAGDITAEVMAKVDVNGETGLSTAEAQIDATAPVLDAMRSADRFRVTVAASEDVFPLTDADLPQLLDLCRKPQ